MRTLVTGAAGFLGTALSRRLSSLGNPVRALIRSHADASTLQTFSRVEIVRGDVTQPETLKAAVEDIELVFHLAGLRRGTQREQFMQVNAEGTRHLCESLKRRGGPVRFIFCGSLAAAGPSLFDRPRLEEDPLDPLEWYGESKAEGERIALGYHQSSGPLQVSVIRPPRILGPGDHENLTFFKLVAQGWHLVIGGGPRPLTLVDVEDVVDLLLVMAVHPAAVGEAFFAAGPTGSLEELQRLAAEVLGKKTRMLYLPPWLLTTLAAAADALSPLLKRRLPLNRKLARQLLAPAWTCSGEKAAQRLGFRAQKPLEQSVRESAEWYVREKLL